MTWEQLLTIIGLIATAAGGIWAVIKVVVPKLVDAKLKGDQDDRTAKNETEAFERKIDQLLIESGISSGKESQQIILGQMQQLLALLHDDQEFIRDVQKVMLEKLTERVDRVHVATVRLTDLMTTLNINMANLADKIDDKRE